VKTKLVKDLMIPLSEYATVSEDTTLNEALKALKQSQANFDKTRYRHRAILIYDANRKIVGKVNLHAILQALEPKYDAMFADTRPIHLGFTRHYQKAVFESLKLWQDPLEQLCEKAAQAKVKTFMVTFREGQMIELDATLGQAVHQLVMGHHQSLLVTEKDRAVAVLRLTDVYEFVSNAIMECKLA
jgi:predicted transcriptional regulator